MNRILTESARQRAQRVEKLERTLERLEPELLALRKRVGELEEHNHQLTEAATQRASRVQELERELQALHGDFAVKDVTRLDTDRAFYGKRINELEEHNHQLTEAATQRAARVQELERELQAVRTELAAKDVPRLEAERAFYLEQMNKFEAHNRQLTEAATKYALRAQELELQLQAASPGPMASD